MTTTLLSERQIEDVFEKFHQHLVEPGLRLLGRQKTLPSTRLRVDLLFEDKSKRKVVLELKKSSVSREDVGQLLEYAGLIENSRVILAAPHISSAIKTSFEHYGIEYIEFSPSRIAELYALVPKMQAQGERAKAGAQLRIIAGGVVPEPLPTRTLKDGNIAFKVAYNDRNWHEPCSRDAFHFNAHEKGVPWCRQQANNPINCQSKRARTKADFVPCYDAVALKRLSFSPGWKNTMDVPHVCKEAKVGKVALLTSRPPGEAEERRFVFAILDIARIRVQKGGRWPGTEYFDGSRDGSIVFDEQNRPRFWEFHANPRAPEVIAWGAGLFRYVKDETVRRLLCSVRDSQGFTKDQKKRAVALLSRY